MGISKRLKTVAMAVTPGHRAADIGTDHGYVPVYLLEQKRVPAAIAMDINKGPLERARQHIKERQLQDKIEVRLSDGLEKLQPGEADTLIFAGMGGNLMTDILRRKPQFCRNGVELVLQPQSEWTRVRKYLEEIRYRITREWFLKEEGKYYIVIKAEPWSGSDAEYSLYSDDRSRPAAGSEVFEEPLCPALIYEYGLLLLDRRDPVLMEYLSLQLRKKTEIIKKIRFHPDIGPAGEKRLAELKQEIISINQILQLS